MKRRTKRTPASAIPEERIERRIHLIREQKVMLDVDLALLYGVRTKELNKAVRRNPDRFPEDFMFPLSGEEVANLRFQIGTSSWGGRRYRPLAFSEQGVAMLSSVLRSRRAIRVNVEIVRVFVRLRRVLASQARLTRQIFDVKRTCDLRFKEMVDALQQFAGEGEDPAKPRIGFHRG